MRTIHRQKERKINRQALTKGISSSDPADSCGFSDETAYPGIRKQKGVVAPMCKCPEKRKRKTEDPDFSQSPDANAIKNASKHHLMSPHHSACRQSTNK